MCRLFKTNRTLTQLELTECWLQDEHISSLCEALSELCVLREVRIANRLPLSGPNPGVNSSSFGSLLLQNTTLSVVMLKEYVGRDLELVVYESHPLIWRGLESSIFTFLALGSTIFGLHRLRPSYRNLGFWASLP